MKSLRVFPIGAVAVAALLAPSPALTQHRAVIFSARGGGFSALNDLNDAGTADFTVTFHQQGTRRLGAGLNYQIPRSNWTLYAQGDGYGYKVSDFSGGTVLTGFDKTQVDFVYSGGLSYRLPF